jgi:hypothetical protein
MKNHATKSVAQISATLNKFCNLKTPQVVKTWHFIFVIVDTLKQILFLQQGHKKKTQIKLLSSKSNENKTVKVKTTEMPPIKRFLYSYRREFDNRVASYAHCACPQILYRDSCLIFLTVTQPSVFIV